MDKPFDLSVIQSDENAARYVWQDKLKKSIIPNKGVIPNLFMPRQNVATGRYELSTFRVEGLRGEEALELGDAVAKLSGKLLAGQVVLKISKFLERELELDADNIPIDRHMNVVGWDNDKDRQLLDAIELAAASHFEDREHFMLL